MIIKGGAPAILTRIREHYGEGVMMLFFATLLATVYFGATTILPPVMFLGGLLLLGYLDPRKGRPIRHFLPAVALSGGILLLAFFRSDFVEMIALGMPVGKAYAASTRYFQAPIFMWFTTWAMVCAAWGLKEDNSRRVIILVSWGLIALTCVMLADAVSTDGMRNAMNRAYFGGHRPEMVVVDASNLNGVLLMLFWPLSFWLVYKRWFAAVGLLAVTILWTSVTVDTNAHMLCLIAGGVVFAIARYWPNGWTRRGFLPEHELAGLAVLWILAFPIIILILMRAGEAVPLARELPPSWGARIDIWSTAVGHSLEKPFWGWGYEASRRFAPAIPLHTHDMSLQAWLELGIPGLLLLAGFWFCVFWFIAPRDSRYHARRADNEMVEIGQAVEVLPELPVEQLARPYMLAGAACYFLLNALSYGMWRAWLYCLGGLMVVVAVMAVKAVKADKKLQILQ
ncbi:O-antigen ligase family protein [Asticcacaulis solisilvae]|uniref:O-antigen ligase family protein n=1 Tax=Asticcacaulis solisilvae TaxID=1217274 RepID=UPI003FD8B315